MYTLILTEKPSAAKSIAEALSDGKPAKKGVEGERAFWYEFSNNGNKFVCVPAVGHLFTLKQSDKGWSYPSFNVEWVPSFKASKFAAFSQPYFRNIENLAKEAKDVIIATDYDDEGEVIGYNILKYILGRSNASRMKFSTMTKQELLESYENMIKLNKNLIESGLARHYLDWYWGINLTRALTNSIKLAAKRFRILSTGRVQGPVLHMLAKHEKKIKAFKPKPFWEIELEIIAGKKRLIAQHTKGKIFDESEAKKIHSSLKGVAAVKSMTTKTMMQKPPKPYNTTSFLADIYRYFGYSPQQGLAIAETLYQGGLISYPRTASEKLPKDINYKKIITALGRQKSYEKGCKLLLSKTELKPEEGSKIDTAHPAIYPTGEIKAIGDKQKKVYDLVVRRFLACFGDPAKRESQKVVLSVGEELFSINGKRTIEPGWTALYGKYAAREDVILPEMKIGDKLQIKEATLLDKQTQPPSRFSQGSVLKEMESKNLGTKSTRASILQILYNRGYVIGRSIEVTELGMQLSEILEKNVPDVVSEKLTRHFEEECDLIEAGKEKREQVLEEAQHRLEKICTEFKKREKKVGEELTKAVIATQDKQSILGKCKCGGTLKVHKLWRTGKRFVGCTNYKKCGTGYPLPREGTIMPQDKICEECKTPIIRVQPQARRPFRMCVDPLCPTKKDWLDKNKLAKAKRDSIKATKLAQQLKCPECGKEHASQRALTMHKKIHLAKVA